MPIEIRPGNLESDGARLIEVIARWLTPRSDRQRFDWLYLNSPFGAARVWLAVRKEDDSIVGAAAAFPRRLYVEGTEVPACVYGDFCVAPEQRSVGLALRLQRACFQALESGWAAIAYDFPSSSMTAIYERLQCGNRGPFVRMALPLRADRKIKQRIKNASLAAIASSVVNGALSLRTKSLLTKRNWDISPVIGPCGEEFSHLAYELRGADHVSLVRTSSYLNWRYVSHPFLRHEILAARRGDRLRGYLVFCQDSEQARLVDLFGVDDPGMFAALIGSAVELLRPRGTTTLSAPILPSHPRAATLKRFGFFPRESSDVFYFLGPGAPAASLPLSLWFLMDGDRDS